MPLAKVDVSIIGKPTRVNENLRNLSNGVEQTFPRGNHRIAAASRVAVSFVYNDRFLPDDQALESDRVKPRPRQS